MLADTGSSWTWFPACDPKKMENCPPYYYDTQKSESLKCTNETVFIQYGSGDVHGTKCEDEITAGSGLKTMMPILLELKEIDEGAPDY